MTTSARPSSPKADANPVYQRITAGDRGPSARATRWIGIGAGLAGFALAARLTLAAPSISVFATPLALTLAGVLLGLISLPAFVIAGAVIAAPLARPESMALLRVTGLAGCDIVAGVAEAGLFRMRAARAVCIGLLPGIWLGTVLATAYGARHDLLASPIGAILVGLPVALIALAGTHMRTLTAQAARIGAAISLRWRDTLAVAVGAAIASLTCPVMACSALMISQSGLALLLGVAALMGIPVLVTQVHNLLLDTAAAYIDKGAGAS